MMSNNIEPLVHPMTVYIRPQLLTWSWVHVPVNPDCVIKKLDNKIISLAKHIIKTDKNLNTVVDILKDYFGGR